MLLRDSGRRYSGRPVSSQIDRGAYLGTGSSTLRSVGAPGHLAEGARRGSHLRARSPASNRRRDRPTHHTRPRDSSLPRSEEHTSELQSRQYLVCRLLLEKKKKKPTIKNTEYTKK